MLSHNTNANIILANDDPAECKLLKDALETLNIQYNLLVIQDGKVLVDFLKDRKFLPDLIFWDQEVPCTRHLDCLQLIRKSKRLRSVPIVVFSKSDKSGSKDYCYNTPANEYFLRALSFLL